MLYTNAPRYLFTVKDNHEPILSYKWALVMSLMLILFSIGAFAISFSLNYADWLQGFRSLRSLLEVIGLAYGHLEIVYRAFLLTVMVYCIHPFSAKPRTHDPLVLVDELKFPITTEIQICTADKVELNKCPTTSMMSFDFSDNSLPTSHSWENKN